MSCWNVVTNVCCHTVLVVKPELKTQTALQECERSFSAFTSAFQQQHKIKRWLVAHSGGVDSQLLLYLTKKCLSDLPIIVIHINHHLQADSCDWGRFSVQQAENLGLQAIIIDLELPSSSENAARKARYAAFTNIITPGDCLLQGHHGDDQAETLLFRMLRGSGLKGMLGIPLQRRLADGHLLRPLLDLTRTQIERAVETIGLDYIDDPSNAEDAYDRNYLRLHVLPLLRQRWPDLARRWRENTERLSEAHNLLEHYLASDLALCSDGQAKLSISAWKTLLPLRRPEVLRYWVSLHTGINLNKVQLRQVQTDLIEAAVDSNPVFTRKGLEIRRFKEHLYLLPEQEEVAPEVPFLCSPRQELVDGVLEIKGKVPVELFSGAVIRRRQGGERCRPQGITQSKKVKKMLQDAGIEPWHRERWPLIYVGEQLAAVPGICICQGFAEENAGFSLLWHPFSLSDNV